MRKEELQKSDRIQSQEKGSAIIIALLIMVLLLGFVALAVSRTSNETVASANDAAETKSFEASHGSLEIMTHNFNKIFQYKLNASNADLTRIQGQHPPGFPEYDFTQTIAQTQASQQVVMTGQQFQGLKALRDEWQIDSTARHRIDGVEVALRRRFFNNRIPIFQFGIFYDDDLEFHPGPRFDFGGRVHSNRHIFMKANKLYFSSKVTAKGEIFTDVMRNGNQVNYTDKIRIKNASGNYVFLNSNMGSVLNQTVSGSPTINEVDMPIAYDNVNWESNEALFQGNLLANQKKLDLPLKISSGIAGNELDYIELIKRGKSVGDLYKNETTGLQPVTSVEADTSITSLERYYNKTGFRISLADSKAKLPGCATGTGTAAVTTACGIRLDGDALGQGSNPSSGARGYQPRTMKDGYQATRINGERFYRGTGVQSWIKIETVSFDGGTQTVVTKDITEDILSLGVTEAAPLIGGGSSFALSSSNYYSNNIDTRSVVKLQRFIFGDGHIDSSSSPYITTGSWGGIDYNFVVTDDGVPVDNGTYDEFLGDHDDHKKDANIAGYTDPEIVPFPIKMFDTREGLYHDNLNTSSVYGSELPSAGIMSVIDIDVANLRKFLNGDYNTDFPDSTPFQIANSASLKASDIPEANGWVVYISDRRGDGDFDGEYDMEDIFGNNDDVMQFGEDINNNGILDRDYLNEAVKYRSGAGHKVEKGIAATIDHKYYRRVVRLINAERLPGEFNIPTPNATRGFTVASENAIYTLGNYNATGISSVGSPTVASHYLPNNTAAHVPASVVGDAVTILSNNWTDGNGFKNAFSKNNRLAVETTVRYAIMSGDARSSLIEPGEPDQGGGDVQLTGGVHNFKRTLEKWSSKRLNYSGSLINLYNSRNNNAAFKCCSKVYSPPTRNWVFDATFLDPNRIPPGTPFFQTIQKTGFERRN